VAEHMSANGARAREAAESLSTTPPASVSGVATEEIFLSPRVIDRSAFESYAARLREMVESAQSQRGELAATITQAAETHKGLMEIGTRNKDHLDLATKLLRSLNQKTGDVEGMLGKAQEIAALAGRFEQEAERVIGAKVSALEKRMAESHEAFARQIQNQIDSKSRDLTKNLDEMRAARELIKKQVDQNVVASVTALREACERAELLVGHRISTSKDAPPRTPTAGSLGDLVRKASEAAEKSQSALKEFLGVEQRSEDSIRRLSESLGGSIEFMDSLHKQRTAVIGELNQAIQSSEESQQRLSDRAAEAARVFKPISELRRNAEETAAKLQAMVNEAETVHSGGATVAMEIRHLVERLEEVARRIEPWRPLLLEQTGPLEMPEQVAELIERIRAEVSADLSKMAAAMNLIAVRAASANGGAGRGRGEVVVRASRAVAPSSTEPAASTGDA